MTVHVCTIIARNYLASARVLFESFRNTNPDGTFSVLIIDDRHGDVSDDAEPFEVLRLHDVGIDKSEALKMAGIYNITEFATAVKPWLLEALLDRWGQPIIYLDPDIMVFQSLDEIVSRAADHDVVITPHTVDALPRDDRRISESEVLAAGIYNLGFIAVGPLAGEFLGFWKERLRRDCISDPAHMRFVDQRWVDFAPALFNADILKDPAYNVAYWNLHARSFSLEQPSGQPLVNGLPVRFFHFSGYDPRVPELLSKYQGGKARILFSREPELHEFCNRYGEHLFAKDHERASKLQYGYANLDIGLKYDQNMRIAYRTALLEAEESDRQLPPNPFESAEMFFLWLNSPDGDDVLSRYLKAFYDSRLDLQSAFPDANGKGAEGLIDWCWEQASKDNFERRLIPPTPILLGRDNAEESTSQSDSTEVDGIEISGYFRAEMGVGELGRNLVKVVAASGLPYSTLTDTDVIHRQKLDFEELEGSDHAVNVVCMNADSMIHFAYRVGPDYFKDRYTIGVWSWELDEFPPEFDDSFEYVDEVWGNSTFTRDAIAKRGLKPVFALPVTLDDTRGSGSLDRKDLGIPGGYMFLFCFDLLSVFERKNPLAVIDAFTAAFSPSEGPVLVIKALNGDKRLAELEKIRIRARGRSDIIVLDEYLDHQHNVGLFGAADCYVSLHRSEGLGLTIAEAMLLGKPVIATAYSGNMDFMDERNSYLVPYTFCEVQEGSEPYRPGARWADPNVSEASRLMRQVYEDPAAARVVGEQARKDMLEKHSPKAAASFVRERYEFALNRLARDEASETKRDSRPNNRIERVSDLEGPIGSLASSEKDTPPPLISLASRPVAYEGVSRFGRVGATARRILRKLLLVRDNQQQEMNLALAMGTEHLARLWNEMTTKMSRMQDQLQRAERERQGLVTRFDMLNRIENETKRLVLEQDANTNANMDLLRGAFESVLPRVAHLEQVSVSNADQHRELAAKLEVIPYMSDPDTFTIRDGDRPPLLGFTKPKGDLDGYASFEDIFRGPEDFIRSRQEIYLRYVNAKGTIVDLGSGRGEFLDALESAGMSGLGVDSDSSMVTRSKDKGHKVAESDVLDFLREQGESSLSTIFSAQFIEHLAYEQLLTVVRESRRTLIDDGILIMETVNPYSLPAFLTFWTDLTHQRPIFPEVLLAIVRDAGFRSARVIFPNGTGKLENDRWTQGEYAVIAVR